MVDAQPRRFRNPLRPHLFHAISHFVFAGKINFLTIIQKKFGKKDEGKASSPWIYAVAVGQVDAGL